MSGVPQFFYVVANRGTGVYPTPFRPDVPAGTPWAGQRIPAGLPQAGNWVIMTPATTLPGYTAHTDAQARTFAASVGLDYDAIVASWSAS
jgi:hypothetical protein